MTIVKYLGSADSIAHFVILWQNKRPDLPFLHLIVLMLVLQPEKVKFNLRLGQSKPIYEAFKAMKESSCWQTMSDARKRIVEGILCTVLPTNYTCCFLDSAV